MAMSSVPVQWPAISAAEFLAHPLHSATVTLAAWKEHRRQRAHAALLMRLEPHMLKDIGVTLVEHHGPSGMLKWHPALLATTWEARGTVDEDDEI